MSDEARVELRSVKTLAQHRHLLVRARFTYRRRDGEVQTLEREVYRNGTGAAVLPFDPRRNTVVLTRQFRIAAHVEGEPAWLVEAPAGTVEHGQGPSETARIELRQETGHRLRDLRRAVTVYASPGTTSERMHLFLAHYDPAEREGAGGGLREEGEEIDVIEMPLTEAWAMVGRGAIVDAKTVLLLQQLLLEAAGRAEG